MRNEEHPLAEFLRARREQLVPEQVGVPDYGRRRVAGLRHEEIAHLAGVSATYCARLEQGRDRHPSVEVLDALARALLLDEAARRHLHALAATALMPRRPAEPERVRGELRGLLDRHVHVPAYVLGRHMDVLASNRLARALHVSLHPGGNIVRDAFLDDEARSLYRDADLDAILAEGVALLHASAAADLDDPRLTELVGELSLKSEEFRLLWPRHDVREKSAGVKRYVHPLVGELTLEYESFVVGGADRQKLVVCHAQPGSASEQALTLLGSIAETGG